MTELPSGTVTFLFTDLEVSTRLWEQEPEAMRAALARHDAILRESIAASDGHLVKGRGDGVHAVFPTADAALRAAVDVQRAIGAEDWSVSEPLRARIGLHTGVAELRDGDYFGSSVNRAARLMGVAHGGQIVVSQATADLARDDLPDGVSLFDLGEHRLRDLTRAERIFQVAHPELEREFPALQAAGEPAGNLPVERDRFVGRAASIPQITALVNNTTVVTLTGPGGVGKTRLALQVAAELQAAFPDGAWLVDLAPVNTADRVAAAALETLGYTLAAGEDDVTGLCARLRRRRLLLVVDNCEHLVASVAVVVDAISTSAPDVRVIATSREGLGIPAERVIPVTPLATDADGDAVELFVTRARAARPDFALDAETTPTVVELCRRLDGIPLAIELAAARARSIAPAQILERLDERFRMLTGGSRTAVPRHQTLQAAVDWSYELLTDAERAVLDRLSVFAGSFTLDAAEAVAADDEIDPFDVLEHVSALVDKSLVVTDPAEAIYRLLETIRQYAAGRLVDSGTAESVRARHAEYYRAMAAKLGPELMQRNELSAMARLSADIENIRVTLDWYQDHAQAAVVVDVLWELSMLWFWRGHGLEIIARLEPALDGLGDDHLRLSRAQALLAWLKALIGYVGIPEHVDRAAEHATLAGIPTPFQALNALGTYYMTFEGDSARAIEQAQLVSTVARADGDGYWAASAQVNVLIYTALLEPGADATLRLVESVRQQVERTGNVMLRQQWLNGAGIAVRPFDLDRSMEMLDESVELARQEGLRDAAAVAEFFRGLAYFTKRRGADAAAALRRSLVGNHDMGNRRGMFNVLSAVAGVVERAGRTETAALILAGLRAAREEYQVPGSAFERDAETRIEEHLRRQAEIDGLPRHVPSLDLEATIDLALNTLDDIATDGRM